MTKNDRRLDAEAREWLARKSAERAGQRDLSFAAQIVRVAKREAAREAAVASGVRYRQSPKGREVMRRYAQSPRGRAAARRYALSLRGAEARRAAARRYYRRKNGVLSAAMLALW